MSEIKDQVKNQELVVLLEETQLQKERKQEIAKTLGKFFDKALEWEDTINSIKITSPTEEGKMKVAKEQRLALKKMRLDASKRVKAKRDIMKAKMADDKLEDTLWLRAGQMIDATFKNLETKAEHNETFKIRWEAEEKRKLKEARDKEIEPLSEFIPFGIDYSEMPEAEFRKLVDIAKEAQARKIKEDAQAELDRIEKERIDKLHRERDLMLRPYWSYLDEDVKVSNFGLLDEDQFQLSITELKELKKADDDKRKAEAEEARALAIKNAELQKSLQAEKSEKEELKKEVKTVTSEKEELSKKVEATAPLSFKSSNDKEKMLQYQKSLKMLLDAEVSFDDELYVTLMKKTKGFLKRVYDFIDKELK